MIRRTPASGFTLIELTIVVTIIAMVAAIAVPRLVSARMSANESATIGTLRTIAAAQAQMIASGAIDTDADGGGEAGFFGELSGGAGFRVWSVTGPSVGADGVRPPQLGTAFQTVVSDGTDGVIEHQGYYYKMFLPDASWSAPIGACPEAPGGGPSAANMPGSANAEIFWCCYAWPVEHARTGHRAFVVNEVGEVLATRNIPSQPGGAYDGFLRVPAFDAAYSVPGDMSASLALAVRGTASQDGLTWTTVGN